MYATCVPLFPVHYRIMYPHTPKMGVRFMLVYSWKILRHTQ